MVGLCGERFIVFQVLDSKQLAKIYCLLSPTAQ